MQQLLSRAQSRSPINCRIHSKYDVCGLAPALSAARASCTAAQTSKSVFPWRHDSILPDRVLERNDYSGTFNPTARDPPILRKLIAARELNIPAWNVMPIPFYKHEWEVTLANNFAAAFQFAVGELLRSLFRGKPCIMFSTTFYSAFIIEWKWEGIHHTHRHHYFPSPSDTWEGDDACRLFLYECWSCQLQQWRISSAIYWR